MRIIHTRGAAIRTVAVSPDGRLIASASASGPCALYDWASGAVALPLSLASACDQFAFPPDGRWMAHVQGGELWFDNCSDPAAPRQLSGQFAGGVAVSPDGKVLVAARAGGPNRARLARWSLPAFQPLSGFDFWSPFRRLAFSPNGQFLAGIWPGAGESEGDLAGAEFELRFAASGGLDYRHRGTTPGAGGPTGFVSFTRDNSLCAFGWGGEFHVVGISTGTSRYLRRVGADFRDAAFTASGRHLAAVGGDGRLTLREVGTWEPVREYDWGCGPLTCLAFTADGSAGVCGTADGRLVQFDVDV
jgi:WD40 repeat protein